MSTAVVTGRERRKNGPLTGRGEAQGQGSRKWRRAPVSDHAQSGDEHADFVTSEIKVEDKPKKRPKSEKPKPPKFVMIWGIDPGMSGSGESTNDK